MMGTHCDDGGGGANVARESRGGGAVLTSGYNRSDIASSSSSSSPPPSLRGTFVATRQLCIPPCRSQTAAAEAKSLAMRAVAAKSPAMRAAEATSLATPEAAAKSLVTQEAAAKNLAKRAEAPGKTTTATKEFSFRSGKKGGCHKSGDTRAARAGSCVPGMRSDCLLEAAEGRSRWRDLSKEGAAETWSRRDPQRRRRRPVAAVVNHRTSFSVGFYHQVQLTRREMHLRASCEAYLRRRHLWSVPTQDVEWARESSATCHLPDVQLDHGRGTSENARESREEKQQKTQQQQRQNETHCPPFQATRTRLQCMAPV